MDNTNDILAEKSLISTRYPFFNKLLENVKYIPSEDTKALNVVGTEIFYNLEYVNSLDTNSCARELIRGLCIALSNYVEIHKSKHLKLWSITITALISYLQKKFHVTLEENIKKEKPQDDVDYGDLFSAIIGDAKGSIFPGNTSIPSPLNNSFKGEPKKQAQKSDTPKSSDSNFNEEENARKKNIWNKSDSGTSISDTYDKNADKNSLVKDNNVLDKDSNSFGGTGGKQLSSHQKALEKLQETTAFNKATVIPEHVIFNDIGEAKQIFDWRRILRESGNNSEVDWSYTNAVIEDGLVRPVLETISVSTTEILLDTSGSVSDALLLRFLQECKNILAISKIKVGCFDTNFYGFYAIKRPEDFEKMPFEGRHGTNFTTAVSAFSKRADNRIIFTDGDAPMPSFFNDVIWIVYGPKRIKPIGGRVFYVDDRFKKYT